MESWSMWEFWLFWQRCWRVEVGIWRFPHMRVDWVDHGSHWTIFSIETYCDWEIPDEENPMFEGPKPRVSAG